jgi:glycosyltransferase involved in cell wall biosynthesis
VRVLHCIPSMEGGGAERQLTYLAAELQRLGVETHVAVVSRGPNWTRLVGTGATIHEIPARGSHDPFLFVRLFSTIRSVDPDLVQVWLRQMDILGGLAALMLRKPLIVTERASKAAYPPSVKHQLRVWIGRFATIVANSEEGVRYWREATRRRSRNYMISNAVPIDEIAAAAPVEGVVPDGRRLVLFAGRMEPQKNLDVLLPALLLALQHEDFDVLFCGEGTLKPRVAEWIDRNRLGPRVKLMGYSPILWSLMKRASVFVSPALFEGTPNVVLEAMACRCPLVVSEIPEHREFLDDSMALFANPTSKDELAAAIRMALRDPASAKARADAAFARVKRFNPSTIAERYVELYRTVLAQPATAVRQVSV